MGSPDAYLILKPTISDRRNPPANPGRIIALFRTERRPGPNVPQIASISRAQRARFHCLTELQNHASELTQHPAAWMPWNYRETLQQTGTSQPSA